MRFKTTTFQRWSRQGVLGARIFEADPVDATALVDSIETSQRVDVIFDKETSLGLGLF